MGRVMFAGAAVWDASGAEPFDGDVLVEGNRIAAVSRAPGKLPRTGCLVIEAKGRTLIPGMTEGHAHLSFESVTATEDLITPPPEEHTLLTARVAKVLLDSGFTSAWGASEAKLRLGVAVRNEVNAGRLPGPRIRAGSLEITVTGGMGDESRLHNPRQGPSIVVDGPEEMRKVVRMCCREGCDNIKLDVSGDPFYPNTPATCTPMTLAEVRMAVETAHEFGRRVNAHARSIGSIQNCLRVAHLEPCADVLDQRVGLQHVVPDLRSELSGQDLAPNLFQLGGRFLLLPLEEASLQHLHRHLAVLHL